MIQELLCHICWRILSGLKYQDRIGSHSDVTGEHICILECTRDVRVLFVYIRNFRKFPITFSGRLIYYFPTCWKYLNDLSWTARWNVDGNLGARTIRLW
jgi:hypothetical protein